MADKFPHIKVRLGGKDNSIGENPHKCYCIEGVAYYVYFAKSICGAEQTLSVLINLFLLAVAVRKHLLHFRYPSNYIVLPLNLFVLTLKRRVSVVKLLVTKQLVIVTFAPVTY